MPRCRFTRASRRAARRAGGSFRPPADVARGQPRVVCRQLDYVFRTCACGRPVFDTSDYARVGRARIIPTASSQGSLSGLEQTAILIVFTAQSCVRNSLSLYYR
jgi:hypothetical protein